MASRIGISSKDQPLTDDPRLLIQLQFLPQQLMQWRVLCFIESFSCSKLTQIGLCLAYKFCDHLTFFPISASVDSQLNAMKVSFFYHQEGRTPRHFFGSCNSELRITRGTEWNRWVAKANINLLKDFPSDFPIQSAMVQSVNTVLFNRREEPMITLSLKAGISADHYVNSKNIKSIMVKHAEIYIPDQHYCTTDPLPTAWMELFDVYADTVSLDEEMVKDIYVPTLSHAEMLRMEDITSPMKKLKRAAIDPNHVPFHRCCLGHSSTKKVVKSRRSRLKVSSSVPRLELGELHDSTAAEVKRMHSSVSDYLHHRPSSGTFHPVSKESRPISASTTNLKRLRKRGTTERTGASSNRSSYASNSMSSIKTPSSRRKFFERHMWLINQYANGSS